MAKTRRLKVIGGEQVAAACLHEQSLNLNHVEKLDLGHALEYNCRHL